MTMTRAVELQEKAWESHAQGELDQALHFTLEALRSVEAVEGPRSPDAANLLNEVAELSLERSDLDAAWSFASEAQAVEAGWDADVPSDDDVRIRAKTASLLGHVRQTRGHYALAEAHLIDALTWASRLGDECEEAAAARNELGVLYKFWGRFDEALALYESALRIFSALHGEDSDTVGTVLHNIGGARHAQGRFDAAEEPARRAWEISKSHFGVEHPRSLADATAYAAVLDGLRRHAEAEALCREAHRALEATFGPDHYEVASNLHNLAATVEAQGRSGEAERLYRRALAQKIRLFGQDHPDVALTFNNLGRLLTDVGRAREAVPLLEAAVTSLEHRLLPSHPQELAARRSLERALTGLDAAQGSVDRHS